MIASRWWNDSQLLWIGFLLFSGDRLDGQNYSPPTNARVYRGFILPGW